MAFDAASQYDSGVIAGVWKKSRRCLPQVSQTARLPTR